jgi:hypothetical protein
MVFGPRYRCKQMASVDSLLRARALAFVLVAVACGGCSGREGRALSTRCDAIFREANSILDQNEIHRLSPLTARVEELREVLLTAGDRYRWSQPLYIANVEFKRLRTRWPDEGPIPAELRDFVSLGWACNRVAPRDAEREDEIEHTGGVMRSLYAINMGGYTREMTEAARSPDEMCAAVNLQIEAGQLVGGPPIDCSDRVYWPARE